MTIQAKDFGSYLGALLGTATKTITAAGTGDAAYEEGAIADMQSLDHPLSGLIVIPYSTTLAEDKTLTMKVKIEHGDESNLSDAADYAFGMPDGTAEQSLGVVATGDTGGSTETGIETQRIDLSGLKRYFRIDVYVDLNATGTDTVTFSSALVYGGMEKVG
jgi:hypothetical protein